MGMRRFALILEKTIVENKSQFPKILAMWICQKLTPMVVGLVITIHMFTISMMFNMTWTIMEQIRVKSFMVLMHLSPHKSVNYGRVDQFPNREIGRAHV